jgi:acyl dehydratase
MGQVVDRNELEKFIGQEAEPTDWHTITQDQIDQFADCTLDHQYIHVDPEKAKETVFGTTIAHGFLTLSMLSHFASSYSLSIKGATMGINSGFDKVRFLSPVKVGSRIRALATFADIKETKPGQFRILTNITVEIEGEETPALVAEWIGIQFVA